MKQRGVAERDYQAIEAFEHTDMTHDAIRTMRTYEEAKLQNAGEESSQVSLEERQKAQFMISKYDRAIERIDALQEILDLAEQGNIPSVALQSASLGDQDIVDLSEQYMRAKAMNDNATKDLNDIVQFNASREAYATVSQIEEKLEKFSVAEREELTSDFKHSFGVFSKEDLASDLKDLAMRDNISEEVRNLLSQYDSSNNLKDYIATVSPDNIHEEDIISNGQAAEALSQATQFNALVEAIVSDDKLHNELHEAIDQLRTSCPEEVCRAVEADLTSKIDESRIQTLAEVLETVYAESEHPAQILDDVIESKNESPAPIPDNVIEPEEDPVGFNLEMIPSIDSHFMDLFSSSDKDKITRGEIAREDHQNVSEEEYRKSAFEVQKYGFEPIVDALTVICEDNLHGGAKDYAKTFLSTYMQECVFQLNLDELGKWTEALKGSQMDDTVKAELLNHCKDVAETKQSGMDHSKSEGKDIEDNANKDNDKTHDADAKADDGLDF